MAFIPVPSTAEFVMTYTLPNGNVAKNVYHVREAFVTPWDPNSLAAFTAVFTNWETNTARPQRSSQVTLTNVLARDLGSQDSYVVETAVSIAGTQANPALPANVTWAVKCVTGLAGRSFRGRTYWVGLSEAMVSGDFVLAGNATAIQAALNTLRTTIGGASASMVVVSKFHDKAPREVGVATDITSWQYLDTRVDTQRRRLIGEGQ